jgi:uncharacterized protein YbjQ (UPF0145 family)
LDFLELPPWEVEEQKKWEQQFANRAAQQNAKNNDVEQEQEEGPPVILATTETVTARRITYLGLVQGSVVLPKNLIGQALAGTESNLSGEIDAYTRLMIDSRKIAVERMIGEARRLNANGIVALRYHVAEIVQGAVEIIAYGTAVTLI